MIDEQRPSSNPGYAPVALEVFFRTGAGHLVEWNLNWEVALGLGGSRKRRKEPSHCKRNDKINSTHAATSKF